MNADTRGLKNAFAQSAFICVYLRFILSFLQQHRRRLFEQALERSQKLRGGGAVYLTQAEYVSLAVIWGAGTVLLLVGLRGARRLARTRHSPRR